LKGEKTFGDWQNINIFSYSSSVALINDFKKNIQRTCKTMSKNRFSIIINEPETISFNGIQFTLKDYMYDVLFTEGKGHVIPSYPDFLGQFFTGVNNSLITNIGSPSYLIPRLKELLPLICTEALRINGRDSTRLASTGIRRTLDQNLIELKEPDNFEIVKAVFKDKELDISLSDKGHIANKVISLLGGLEKCDILTDNEVIKLIRGMIDKEGNPVIKPLNEVKAFFKKDKEKNVENLLKFKILFRGYNIKCKDCGTNNWVSINDAKETISCSGCLNEISLPINSEVIYKLNSLVIHSFNQGALTHINNIVRIRKANFKFYVPGLKILSLDRELDMVLITDDGIIIGECKNNAKELKTQEYDSIMHIGELIKAKKVVFGSLFNKFSKAIKGKNDSEVIFIEEGVSDKDLSGVRVQVQIKTEANTK
jgi:ribosomal protein S27E